VQSLQDEQRVKLHHSLSKDVSIQEESQSQILEQVRCELLKKELEMKSMHQLELEAFNESANKNNITNKKSKELLNKIVTQK